MLRLVKIIVVKNKTFCFHLMRYYHVINPIVEGRFLSLRGEESFPHIFQTIIQPRLPFYQFQPPLWFH